MSFDSNGLDKLLDQKGFQGKEVTRIHGISVETVNEEIAGIYRGYIWFFLDLNKGRRF